ncbi:MAG: transcriptional repressor NrdR [Syntrophobacterales bacterium]|nr:MAG: transcriptional repressor NrdR [Syntrophobacterales bacterium]
MKCPFCSGVESRVADSRLSRDKETIRRRRQCLDCGRRFTTSERIEGAMPMVVKRDGRREPFNRLKIMNGLRKACEKRPISIDHLERIVNRIEQGIQEAGEREVKSTLIGQKVTDELRSLDGVAYVRFASVYRQFKDINEFMDELTELLGNRTAKGRKGKKKR